MGAQAVLDGPADLADVWAAVRAQGRTRAAARRCLRVDRKQEAHAAVRGKIEALPARERPGWRVAEVAEVNDESGPTFEVVVESGDERRTVLVSADERFVGERR